MSKGEVYKFVCEDCEHEVESNINADEITGLCKGECMNLATFKRKDS